MKIVILYGGKSGEHEISLVSATAVLRNLDENHEIFLIGISKLGAWFLQSDSEILRVRSDDSATLKICEDEENRVWAIPAGGKKGAFATKKGAFAADVVLPILHGTFGEDGTVQGLLETLDVPYVGCGVGASAWTMDKEKTKALLQNAGISVVAGVCVRRSDFLQSSKLNEKIEQAEKDFGYPIFVKPCSAGSSNGAQKTQNRAELDDAIRLAFDWDDKILLEEAIDAREIECSVIGNPTTQSGKIEAEELRAFGPGEIASSHGFYDYDAKYNDPNGASLLIPAPLSEEMREMVRENAKKAFCALDLSGLARVDFFVDRKTNTLYLNEINTIPGFTQISMFPKMCIADGIPFKKLTQILIEEAIARFETTRKLKTSR